MGNVLINRNFRDFDGVRNALDPDGLKRFSRVEKIFRTYGEQYGLDYLMVAAQGYRESRLDQSVRSPAKKKAQEQGLDLNVCFGNVEVIAAREIGHEALQ